MIQTSESFNKYISTLVLEFVTARNEEIECLIQVEIIVTREEENNKGVSN